MQALHGVGRKKSIDNKHKIIMNNNNNKNEKTMVEKRMNMEQGHWVLAKLGKKVLRPGGKALTQAMLNAMNITPDDDVVEFAPGLGYTAKLALSRHPHS